jgi:hypothetical protein
MLARALLSRLRSRLRGRCPDTVRRRAEGPDRTGRLGNSAARRKAILSRPEVAAAAKADRLATINGLAGEYAQAHDAQLRPGAKKIVELENDQAEQVPVEPTSKKKKAA